VEYNSQATFNPDFLVDPNGGTGVFGMRANGRMIPESVTSLPSSVLAIQPELITNPTGTAQAAQINDAMRKISPVIAPRTEAPGPNVSVNLQGGDTVGDENDGQMGVLGAFSWRKKYTFDPQGTRGNLTLSPGDGGVINSTYQALNQAQGNQDLLYGSLLSLSGQWEKDQTVGANLIFNEGATSSAATRTQEEIVNNIATQQILQYGERSLLFAQFHGDHLFPEVNGLELTWNGGLGQAKLQEPNQTQFSYIYNPAINFYDIGGAQAFQRELTENSYYTIADLTLPFLKKDEKENIFKTVYHYYFLGL
jgi:hypothetical protein